MRKQIFGKRLKRDTKQRKALLRGLMREMVLNGEMKTTQSKAKAVKGSLEKIVTKAIKNSNAENELRKDFTKEVANRIIVDIAPKFKNRPGGYTRLIKVGKRQKDNAPMVLMQWVEKIEAVHKVTKKGSSSQGKLTKSSVKQSKRKNETAPKEAKTKTAAPRSKAKTQVRRVQKKG